MLIIISPWANTQRGLYTGKEAHSMDGMNERVVEREGAVDNRTCSVMEEGVNTITEQAPKTVPNFL